MEEEKNYIEFSAENIRKYLEGDLPDQAMQALEKAALEDPFLADAIEGYEESRKHNISFESGITDLRIRLTERIKKQKRKKAISLRSVRLLKWQVAASFILVIGLTVFMAIYTDKKPVISKTGSPSDSISASVIQPIQKNVNRSDTPRVDEHALASAKPLKAEKSSANRRQIKGNRDEGESSSEANAKKSIAAVPSGSFSGSAADTENSKASSKVLADTTRQMEKSESLAKNDLALAQTAALAKSSTEEGVSNMNVKPARRSSAVLNGVILLKYNTPPSVIGWDRFYNYIDSSKKINSADSLLKGEEVISFLLHPEGRMSSFKIEKSVSPAHDAEILRLMQMAPPLKLQEKKKYRCQLQIWFK